MCLTVSVLAHSRENTFTELKVNVKIKGRSIIGAILIFLNAMIHVPDLN